MTTAIFRLNEDDSVYHRNFFTELGKWIATSGINVGCDDPESEDLKPYETYDDDPVYKFTFASEDALALFKLAFYETWLKTPEPAKPKKKADTDDYEVIFRIMKQRIMELDEEKNKTNRWSFRNLDDDKWYWDDGEK